MTDIYNADVSGGWGKVIKQGNQFIVNCRLWIGDDSTSTWFATEEEQVEFTRNVRFTFFVRDNAYGRMGNLDVNSIPCKGSNFLFTDFQCNSTCFTDTSCSWYMYDSEIRCRGDAAANDPVYFRGIAGQVVFKRSKIDFGDSQRFIIYTDAIVDGLELYGNTFITNVTPSTDWNDMVFIGPMVNIMKPHWGSPVTMTNAVIGSEIARTIGLYHATCKLINPTLNFATVTFQAEHEDDYWYVQFTIDLHVINRSGNDIASANVRLKDVDGNTIFTTTTDSNGNITQQTVTYKYVYYNNQTKIYSPFTLEIWKQGFQKYTGNVDLDSKTVMTIALRERPWTSI